MAEQELKVCVLCLGTCPQCTRELLSEADEAELRASLSAAEAEVERLRAGIDEALKWIGSAGISQGSRNMHNKVKTAGDILAAARRQQGGTDVS